MKNIPRMFKGNFTAIIDKSSFEIPKIFKYLMKKGVEESHMFNTYNMGIGMVLCVNERDSENIIKVLEEMGEKAYKIGTVTAGGEGVCLK